MSRRIVVIIDEMDKFNSNEPGWLREVAFLYPLEKGKYDQALHEACRFWIVG